jgi:hypothetical protein
MAVKERKDVLTLEQAGSALEVSPEFIRRRIKAGALDARFSKGSRKLGYIIDRREFVRFLREIGEGERAAAVERGDLPIEGVVPGTDVLN